MKHRPLAPIFINEKTLPARPDQQESPRKTRYDKQAVMKFPVTEEQHKELRYSFVAAKNQKGPLSPGSITEYLVQLVRFGLRHPEMLGQSNEYVHGGNMKTVKPNQVEKSLIEKLAIDWNSSERRAVHGIVFSVLSYLSKGGVLTYEEVQPLRPVK